jgi:hypothetical protein
MMFTIVKGAIDIFVSHDWPHGISQYGNVQQLLHHKLDFRRDVLVPILLVYFTFNYVDDYCLLLLH